MNERVWLQADTTLVNKFRALGLAFLSSLTLSACSGESPSDSNDADRGNSRATAEADSRSAALPAVTVIWGARQTEGYVTDLEIGISSTSTPFILTRTQTIEGQTGLHVYDLDGAKNASSPGLIPEVSDLQPGFPVEIDETLFIAFPFVTRDTQTLGVALASPILGVIGTAPVNDSPRIDVLCKADDPATLAFVPEGQSALMTATISLQGASADVTTLASRPLDGEISGCAIMGETAVVQTSNGLRVLDLAANTPDRTLDFNASDLSLVAYDGQPLLVGVNAAGNVVTQMLQGDRRECEIRLNSGLTIRSPDKTSSLAVSIRAVTNDYPDGLVALTGYYDDGEPRLSYYSLRDMVHACDSNSGADVDTQASPT